MRGLDTLALFVSTDHSAKVSLQKNQCQIEVADLVFFDELLPNRLVDFSGSKDAFEFGFVQLRQFSTQGTIFWAWCCLPYRWPDIFYATVAAVERWKQETRER